MASIRDLYKDPFENYNLLMQKLNRMAYIGEATSAVLKMSGVSSISNVDYLNSMNSALGILQQRMDIFAKPNMNLFSAMDMLSQRLSQYHNMQPQIISSFERVFDGNSKYMLALQRIESIASKLDSNFFDSMSHLSIAETFEYINDLKTVLPDITATVEIIEVEESAVKTDNKTEGPNETRLNPKREIRSYLEHIALIVTIIEALCGLLFSNIPEINVNITNDHSTNYYMQEVNHYYANNYEFYPSEYNSNGFRLVSEKEIVVRVKPDCSSYVVQKLNLGKIVQIVDKHKKWVQIRWKNDDESYSYGWIQNYKLSKFKE